MTFERIEIGPDVVLYRGDCREVLPTLGKVDCVITDPPYGVDFKGKTTKHTRGTRDFPGGYEGGDSDVGPRAVAAALEIADRGVVFPGARLAWKYPEPYDISGVYCPSGAGLGRWGFVVLHLMLFYGMALPEGRQGPSGFSSFATVSDNGHPCPKPDKWMEWAVKKATRSGQTVLDPFMGSGTTGVAALRHGCKFIGIEIEQKYFDIARRRIEAEVAQRKLFV